MTIPYLVLFLWAWSHKLERTHDTQFHNKLGILLAPLDPTEAETAYRKALKALHAFSDLTEGGPVVLSFIRKSSDVVFWSEGGPGDREVGHATNADPNGLRAGWMVTGSVIVST